jgi:hypothetical protein
MHSTVPEGYDHEAGACHLLATARTRVPRHGFIEAGPLPFAPGQPNVLKGIGDQLWHKSDNGADHSEPLIRRP